MLWNATGFGIKHVSFIFISDQLRMRGGAIYLRLRSPTCVKEVVIKYLLGLSQEAKKRMSAKWYLLRRIIIFSMDLTFSPSVVSHSSH